MKEIKDLIMSIGGRLNKECYQILCLAIYYARGYEPVLPQMKVIWADICRDTHKPNTSAVSRALARAVTDIWENGDRALLASYRPGWGIDPPSPKEFIYVMANKLWTEGASA